MSGDIAHLSTSSGDPACSATPSESSSIHKEDLSQLKCYKDEHGSGDFVVCAASNGDTDSQTGHRLDRSVCGAHRKPGEIEVETTVTEVGGPLSTFAGCRKHLKSGRTHHNRFIYLDNFDMRHLPTSAAGVPDEVKRHVVELVHARAKLVVRITGGLVSHGRPDTWADGTGYKFSESRGQTLLKVGSGWVMSVSGAVCDWGCGQTKGGNHDRTCWRVRILTARHVVYDTEEAESCRFDLFDDLPSGQGCVSLSGVGARVLWECTEEDWCTVECLTHDTSLALALQRLVGQWEDGRDCLIHSILEHNTDPRLLPVVVISHPHGKAKHVSVGCHRGEEGEDGLTKLYDSPTCPGSSGGLVIDLPALASGCGLCHHTRPVLGLFKRAPKEMCWNAKKHRWVKKKDRDPLHLPVYHLHAGTKPDPVTGDPVGYSSEWGWHQDERGDPAQIEGQDNIMRALVQDKQRSQSNYIN